MVLLVVTSHSALGLLVLQATLPRRLSKTTTIVIDILTVDYKMYVRRKDEDDWTEVATESELEDAMRKERFTQLKVEAKDFLKPVANLPRVLTGM